MILADTSIWVDYLRGGNRKHGHYLAMRDRLNNREIVMHPFIVAELALGSLHDRKIKLRELDLLHMAKVAHLEEVRHMIEAHSLYSKGIGLTDAHLIASCLMTPGTRLWTRDRELKEVARNLGILATNTNGSYFA